MSELVQPKSIKNHFLMRWIIIWGAMLLIVFLFGYVPVFISYRKFMGT